MMRNNRRVVITGLGLVTSIGIGRHDFWRSLLNGKSGISRISSFSTKNYDRHYGGEIKDFKAEQFIDKRKLKSIGPASRLAIAASRLALADSKLSIKDLPKEKCGVCIGTTMGEAQVLEEMDRVWTTKGDKYIDFRHITLYPSSIIPISIANEFKIKGSTYLFANACAAGNYSIGRAHDLIKDGRAEIMFAGGADAFSRINLTGFSRLFAMSPQICRPFDKNRDGMIVGEGSGILILEELSRALARRANIYAEVLGYGLSCDAYHMTASTIDGVSRCMKKALAAAKIAPDKVDYISAHGTGTQHNDKIECMAIKDIFGKRAKTIPISSIKSMLGHTMGAASAIEAAVCCLAIKDSMIPPTINYETPDAECDIDCVPNVARACDVNIALNNSYAFGGNNACLVLKKYNK